MGTTRPRKCLKYFHAIGVLDMLQEKAFGLNIAATESPERAWYSAYSFTVQLLYMNTENRRSL